MEENTIKPLLGHISEETAYVVNDYPYGFRLRCKIRYWIETHPKHGFRACSQTTNPKLSFEKWNTPKKSTYSKIAECMYLTESDGHVHFCALSQYSDLKESVAFKEKWGHCLNQDALKSLDLWIKMKEIYEKARDEGKVTFTINGHAV